MIKRLFSLLVVVFSFMLIGCEDEANDPIVVNTGGNQDNDDDTDDDDGTFASCVFTGVESGFSSCVTSTSSDQLEVVTWNIKFFPLNGSVTLAAVEDIIYNTNADVIALQEIEEISEFNKVINNLEGWEGRILDISGDINMGYIYKSCEVKVNLSPTTFNGIEPRPAIMTTITHRNGLEVRLFNLHLKCCGGSENVDRRRRASESLKDFIDENYPNDNVIVLGDFNDDLDSDSPFSNFITDASNYVFADAEIAAGDESNFSYPNYTPPSHLDHILITNELFDNLVSTETLKFSGCVSGYFSNVSDHRPVMSVFKADE